VPLPPPLLFALILGGGIGLGFLCPVSFPGSWRLRLTLAGIAATTSFLLAAWAIIVLVSIKASPEFQREVPALAQKGPFRFTRNPLYLSLLALQAAFAGALDNLWILGGMPALIVLLNHLVIAREEAYLRSRFGQDYQQYAQRVRRWL